MSLRTSLLALLCAAGTSTAQAPSPAPAVEYTRISAYPLDTCVVSGKTLGPDAITFDAAGRTFRTLGADERTAVEQNPAVHAAKLDEAILARQLAHYPLDTCPITELKLGSMGAPVRIVLDETLVQLCCPACIPLAQGRRDEIAKRVRDAAFAKQVAAATTCAVSSETLAPGAGLHLMLGTALVRVKDAAAASVVQSDPMRFLDALAPRAAVPPQSGDAASGCACGAARMMSQNAPKAEATPPAQGQASKTAEAPAAGCCGGAAAKPSPTPAPASAAGCCGGAKAKAKGDAGCAPGHDAAPKPPKKG